MPLPENQKMPGSGVREDLIAALRDRAKKLVSLDTPQDQDLGDVATDIGGGFLPVVGTALSARDFERARREGDPLGMGLSALGMIPLMGGVTKGVNALRKGSKAVDKTADALRGVTKAAEVAEEAPAIASRAVSAPKEVAVAKRFKEGDKAGIYRGSEAFGGISPQKLGQMRVDYLRKMEEGTPGRMWYDDTSKDIYRLTGEDAGDADKMANALAITSAGTGVSPNFMHAAKAWNQAAVGDAVKAGRFPNDMGKHIAEAFDDPAASASGLKRSPFSAGLSVEWRGQDFANRPTHDIHDVRAWGIKDPKTGEDWKKGVGEAGHRFLDEQADFVTDRANKTKLGGADDWTNYRAQAAAWIAQKAEKEGKSIEETAKHYGDFINDHSAQITREWVPGDNTGHLLEALRADEPTRRAFSDDMEQIVRGPQGIDMLARKMGALSDRVVDNRGVYEGATNPGYASIIPSGKVDVGNKVYNTDPASEKLLDAVAGAHGLLGTQKQSAWNHLTGELPITRAGGYQVRTGTPFSNDELADLHKLSDSVGGDIPQVDPRGARLLEFAKPGADSRQAMVDALRAKYPEAEIIPQGRGGNLFPSVDDYGTAPEKYSTKPYIEKIEAAGPKVVAGFDEAMKTMAPQALEKTQAWAAKEGWTQAPWFETAMKGLAEGGLAKLKELVAQGAVPVVFMASLGGAMGDKEQYQ